MNTGGHANDGPMVLAPIGIGIVIAVILLGGPAEALDTANALLHEIVHKTVDLVTGR